MYDTKGLPGRHALMTPPTLCWYSTVMESNQSRVESSLVQSGQVELRQKEPKLCSRPLPFYKPKLLIECYVNLRYKNLHSCPVNTLTLKSHRGPSGLRSFCHCVSKWIAGKPLAFFFSSQTKHTPKTLHEK